MCSTPPATTTSAAPSAISPAPAVTAVSAPAHMRSTAKPGTVFGRPASSATSRPSVRPWSPTCAVAARTTSPIRSGGSLGLRRSSSRTTFDRHVVGPRAPEDALRSRRGRTPCGRRRRRRPRASRATMQLLTVASRCDLPDGRVRAGRHAGREERALPRRGGAAARPGRSRRAAAAADADGNAAYGAGLALPDARRRERSARVARPGASARYRESWTDAPPDSWGRPIGAMKARLLAGDDDGEDGGALGARRWAPRTAESPIGRYAAALALPRARRVDEQARVHADAIRTRDDFPRDVGDALAFDRRGRTCSATSRRSRACSSRSRRASEYLEDVAGRGHRARAPGARRPARHGQAELSSRRSCPLGRLPLHGRRDAASRSRMAVVRRPDRGSPASPGSARRRTRAATASAFASPVTRKTTARRRRRAPGTSSSRASPTARGRLGRRRRAARARASAGASGKSDAVCPSGPSPSSTRSSVDARELPVVARPRPRPARARRGSVPRRGGRRDPVEQRFASPCRSSSARRRAGRSARRPTRTRRRSSRLAARRPARRRAAASSRR